MAPVNSRSFFQYTERDVAIGDKSPIVIGLLKWSAEKKGNLGKCACVCSQNGPWAREADERWWHVGLVSAFSGVVLVIEWCFVDEVRGGIEGRFAGTTPRSRQGCQVGDATMNPSRKERSVSRHHPLARRRECPIVGLSGADYASRCECHRASSPSPRGPWTTRAGTVPRTSPTRMNTPAFTSSSAIGLKSPISGPIRLRIEKLEVRRMWFAFFMLQDIFTVFDRAMQKMVIEIMTIQRGM